MRRPRVSVEWADGQAIMGGGLGGAGDIDLRGDCGAGEDDSTAAGGTD